MKDNETLQESFDFLGNFKSWGFVYDSVFQSNNQLWNVTNGNGGAGGGFFTAYYWLNSQYFNKMQRYASRYAYLSCPYAATAVNTLTILVMGDGLKFVTENQSKQNKIDKWCDDNDWYDRDIEGFRRWVTDGDLFYRFFDEKVRFIDPDLIYGDSNSQNQYLGIEADPDDDEEILYYLVHKQPDKPATQEKVPAEEIQHRKNSHWGQRRGFSWLLPVLTDVFAADKLTNSLMSTAEVQARVALIRELESPSASAQTFLGNIQNQPQNQEFRKFNPPSPQENIEHIPPGSIITQNSGQKLSTLNALSGATNFIEVLDASLRKIASHFHLPMGVFAQDKSERGAFAAEMVSNSYIVRCIEALQSKWKYQNLEVLKKALGIETDDVQVICPMVSMVDKPAETQLAQFLLDAKLCSRQTLLKTFGIDWEREAELIKSEKNTVEELDTNDETLRNNQSERGPSGATYPSQRNGMRSDEQKQTSVPSGDTETSDTNV